jgi:hypothetical protein
MEEQEGELQQIPLDESMHIVASRQEMEGREWEVVVIGPATEADLVSDGGREYIQSKNGRLYSVEALAESVPLWSGAQVFDNHLSDAQYQASQGMRSIAKDLIGVIVDPVWDAGKRAITGILKVVDDGFRLKLLNAEKAGVLNLIGGLSIDALAEAKQAKVAGRNMPVIEKISRALSVDVVATPAAGGRLSRMIAGMSPLQPEQSITEDEMAEENVEKKVEEAQATAPQAEPVEPEVPQAMKDALAKAERLVAEAEQRVRLMECAHLLGTKLDESGLPASFRELVAKQFRGKTFEAKDLDEVIAGQLEALKKVTESGKVNIPAGARVSVSPVTEMDRFELSFLRMVAGATRFNELATKEGEALYPIPALQRYVEAGRPALVHPRRLSEWYYDLTEDYDGFGQFRNTRLLEANVNTGSVASIVKNTVNILLANDYSQRFRWWEPIVRQEDVDTIDDATLVRTYGVSNLATIAEGGPYTELDWEDEEETASYAKRGNYIGVTLETFLRDKINILRSLPGRLSNSWYNTVSALVAAVFTTNTAAGPVLTDTGALFNNTATTIAGGHANLLVAALSYTAYDAVVTAMMAQTDQVLGAGQKLLMYPKYLLVPTALRATANQIRNTEMVPGTANFQQNMYGPNGGDMRPEVIVVPNWTDATDWAAVADPAQFPAIWLIWLRGRRTPELFSAEDERSGAMFTNDVMRFKVRQYGYRFSATYDCAPVSDFRPLHKSNVAG